MRLSTSYETLYHARKGAGQAAIEQLNQFFFQGHDKVTGRADGAAVLDVETQALLRLTEQVEDAPDTRGGRDSYPPLCVGAADLLADDIKRLLFYERHIPRSVMVDYLKVSARLPPSPVQPAALQAAPSSRKAEGSGPDLCTEFVSDGSAQRRRPTR